MCSVAIGETVTSISSSVRMLGNEKEKHCDFAGVAGAFMVSQDPDLDDVQDVVELRRAWPRPYSLSRLVLGLGTSSSSNAGPGCDASESDRCGERGQEQLLTP